MATQVFFKQPTQYANGEGEKVGTTWGNDIDGLIVKFTVSVPSLVTVNGHVDFKTDGGKPANPPARFAVGCTLLLNDNWAPGFYVSTNLTRYQHYQIMPLNGFFKVPAGTHKISVQARYDDQTDGDASQGMVLYVRSALSNGLFVRVDPL